MKKTEDGLEFFGGRVTISPPTDVENFWAVCLDLGNPLGLIGGSGENLPGAFFNAFQGFVTSFSTWLEDKVLKRV